MDYVPQLGNAIELVLEPDYSPALGNAIELTLSTGGIEIEVTSGLGLSLDQTSYITGLFLLNETFQFDLNSFADKSCSEFILEEFSVLSTEATQLIAYDLILSLLDTADVLIGYIPTGIIQMLSNPFVITEIESAKISVKEILFSIILTEIEHPQLLITEIIEAVKITEVL